MLKKYAVLILLSATVIASCHSSTNNRQTTDDSSAHSAEEVVSTDVDTQDVQAILGTYSGTLPCADCGGIQTELILNEDSSYKLTKKYVGKNERAFENSGNWTFNEDNKIITLSDIEDASDQYKVEKNSLRYLDKEGKEVKGVLADEYVLLKE